MYLFNFFKFFFFLFLISPISAQHLITFDNREWSSDQSLDSAFSIDNYSFSSNKKFYTNYGYNFDVYNVSVYYVFQEPPEDQFIITASDSQLFSLTSFSAYQVSETSSDTLIVEGWNGITKKYTSAFTNIRTWQIITLNYNNIDKVIFNLGAAGTEALTDFNFDNFVFDDITSTEEKTESPNNYALSQNYPNPFNPSTVIHFRIAKPGKVVLKVYDIIGNEITELVNEYKDGGNYQANFDAKDLSSGIYIYKLITNEFVSIKKMMLIK
jgi:hypothetical protein